MPDELEKAQAVVVAHVMASVMPISHTSPPLSHIANPLTERRVPGCTKCICQHHSHMSKSLEPQSSRFSTPQCRANATFAPTARVAHTTHTYISGVMFT